MSANPLPGLIHSALSYDGNVMLAALISLLLVILFVLLLHIYAKWFLAQARHRRTTSVFVAPARFHHFHAFTLDANIPTLSSSPKKGLNPSVIASLPLFVYKSNDHKFGLECVVCLSVFEDGEMGKKLPKCSHAFHVECIDMWLHSHSNCPICRAPVAARETGKIESTVEDAIVRAEQNVGISSEADSGIGDSALEIVVEVPNNGNENENENENKNLSSTSSCSTVSAQASSLGGSIRTMLSRNRSERKVHPSSNVNESSS